MAPRKVKRPLVVVLAAALVAGCAPTPAVFGLRPEEPRPERIDFVKVDSRQPTLQWRTFPQQRDRESDPRLGAVRDVTYDLRVWRAGPDDYPGALVYTKDGLTETRHSVETELESDTRYLWTVRARFNLDGRPRVTPWSTLDWVVKVGRVVVPDVYYFRFKTPAL